MSPTQEYSQGRLPEALALWGVQLAAGRSWPDIEAEILNCCDGRVDLLTQLLIKAETVRQVVPDARSSRWSSMPTYAASTPLSS